MLTMEIMGINLTYARQWTVIGDENDDERSMEHSMLIIFLVDRMLNVGIWRKTKVDDMGNRITR